MELKRLNIGNLIPGMQNVDIVGRIERIGVRTFSTERAQGRLASVMLGDGTGSIRLVLWNEEIERIKGLREGDDVRVCGYIKQGLYGPELRFGRFGKIELAGRGSYRAAIAELVEGQRKEIRACLVQVFEAGPFYEICPHCGASLKEDGTVMVCAGHGAVEPAWALHISGILDDGTGTIRAVLFRENAERILGIGPEEAKEIALRKGTGAVFHRARLGEYILEGRVRRNKIFDRVEFIVDRIKDVDVRKEIELMLGRDMGIPGQQEFGA